MFCRKCGKEISDDAQFCVSCGTSTEINLIKERNSVSSNSSFNTDNRKLQYENTKNNGGVDKSTILNYLSIILSAIIIFLTFSNWITIDIGLYDGDFSTLDLIEITEKLSRYLDDFSSFFVTILVLFVLTIDILCIYYIVKALQDGIHAVYHGYSSMSAIALICGIVTILTMLFFASSEDFSIAFNENMYFIIILACVNRYAVLPTLGKELIFASEEHILNDDEWLCPNCKHKNSSDHSICKNCGKLR